jgi:hypothetical protein
MTASSSPSSTDPNVGAATYAMDAETQARKRAEIGLAPHRPTAPAAVHRPASATPSWVRWLAVMALLLLILVVVGMVGARSSALPTTLPATISDTLASAFATLPGAAAVQPAATQPTTVSVSSAVFTPWLVDQFTAPSPYVAEVDQAPQLQAAVVPAEGVYRMAVGAGQIGWSLFDTSALPGLRVQTEARVAEGSPNAAAGILARYTDPNNFYVFGVDERGQFFVALVADGQTSYVQEPFHLELIHPAGQANILVVEDTAAGLQFSVNNAYVRKISTPALARGQTGIAALNNGAEQATVDFDWIAIGQEEVQN